MSRFEQAFVWVGGALFVGALAFCAYSYLFVWGRTDAGRVRWPAVAFDALLFAAFAAHHSLFARDDVKAWLMFLVPGRLVRSVFVWTASGLFVAVCALWRPVGGRLYDLPGWAAVALATVQLAGIWIIARAVRAIDALELAGIRHRAVGETLQVAGPYAWVRHPVYLGWLLATFGPAHLTGDRLAFAAISSVYLVVAVPWEERTLVRTFGVHYEEYKRQVRWRIVPYIY